MSGIVVPILPADAVRDSSEQALGWCTYCRTFYCRIYPRWRLPKLRTVDCPGFSGSPVSGMYPSRGGDEMRLVSFRGLTWFAAPFLAAWAITEAFVFVIWQEQPTPVQWLTAATLYLAIAICHLVNRIEKNSPNGAAHAARTKKGTPNHNNADVP
jgi:hypothetical protein